MAAIFRRCLLIITRRGGHVTVRRRTQVLSIHSKSSRKFCTTSITTTSWKKIAPHVHSNELSGDPIDSCIDNRAKATIQKDYDRGVLSKHGVCRTSINQDNEELDSEKFDIIGVSPNVSPNGVSKELQLPIVIGPQDFSDLNYFGIPGVEIQNEESDNPFDIVDPDDNKPVGLHTLTLGNINNGIGNYLTMVVHPHYYDTLSLIEHFFEHNPKYPSEKGSGQKPFILKGTKIQFDYNEIDIQLLTGIYKQLSGGKYIDKVWIEQKKALLNPNKFLSNLNVTALEVYNGFDTGEWSGRLLDEMLMLGKEYFAFAGNDAFFYRGKRDDSFKALDHSRLVPLGCLYGIIDENILVGDKENGPIKAFMDMINKREFYASSGLIIHDENDNDFKNVIDKNGDEFEMKSSEKEVSWRAISYKPGDDEVKTTQWSEPKKVFNYKCEDEDWMFVRFEARDGGLDYHKQIWLQPFYNK